MTGAIGADIDAYGINARASALADYLETRSLLDHPLTWAGLEDMIDENGWADLPRMLVTPEVGWEMAGDWVSAVSAVIDERRTALKDLYPFDEVGSRLQLKKRVVPDASPYISLLAITVLHSWGISAAHKPEDVLEGVVARSLQGKRLLVATTGTTSSLGFVAAVQQAALTLRLNPVPEPLPRRTWAKDAGVDTIAGVTWPDGRSGHWLLLGQVTAGKSETWSEKLKQPEPAEWANWLQELLEPQRFLAVPHHVERWHFEQDIAPKKNGIVLDRLRLAPWKGRNKDDERALIDALMSCRVE